MVICPKEKSREGRGSEKRQEWCLILTVMENNLLERKKNRLKSHVKNFSLDLMKKVWSILYDRWECILVQTLCKTNV